MKLTQEQIIFIDSILILNGIKFDDIKLEMMDHIASEIEILMDENELSFDENFKLVLEKWSEELQPSSSFFTGINVSYPKIILEKKLVLVKKQMLFGFLSSIVALLVFMSLTEFFDAKIITNNFQVGARYVFVIGYLLLIFNTIRIWRSKLNTSFYMNHKSRLTVYISMIYPFCFINTTPTLLHNQVLFVVLSTFMLFHLLFSSQLALKHFQFEKKLSNS
ncbi:hypothetical protein SAMN05444395_101485 [Flavobacterium fryxellicola]|uniref:Uncharacterized protein n=1 Tax=Flavobacterium fryxellicola TaxID=249352 RepID=A0A168AIM7_9FLAO|nr:hypothetical protein [Flavobacterium fryxellicola]OAB31511.1 hypothetical protein FBFR_01395 [Flavobacterium fryxellicola]SHN53191.1 hypothetical protein SAMN05444395_101485 [Flavobacterium fryxellicola]